MAGGRASSDRHVTPVVLVIPVNSVEITGSASLRSAVKDYRVMPNSIGSTEAFTHPWPKHCSPFAAQDQSLLDEKQSTTSSSNPRGRYLIPFYTASSRCNFQAVMVEDKDFQHLQVEDRSIPDLLNVKIENHEPRQSPEASKVHKRLL